MQPYRVIINETSGTTQKLGKENLEKSVRDGLGEHLGSLHFVPAPDLMHALPELARNSNERILLGGGDGTMASSAKFFIDEKVPFGILPLGTMNLLARDLNVPVDLLAAVQAYKNVREEKIDVGMVNDYIFLCNAALGVIPEASIAREEARATPSFGTWSTLMTTILGGLDPASRHLFRLRADGRKRSFHGNVLVIANNSYHEEPSIAAERLLRPSLRDGVLAIYTASSASKLGSFRLLADLALGRWQTNPVIKSFTAKNVILDYPQGELLVSIDGEPIKMNAPLNFKILPRHMTILVPHTQE